MFKKTLKFFSVEQVVFISIIWFIVATPNLSFFVFDQQRIFQIGIVFFSMVLALINTDFRQLIIQQFFNFSSRTRLLLLALLILAVSSAFSAPLVQYALLENCLYCGLFFLSLSIAHLSFQKNNLFPTVFFTTLIVSSFFYQITFFAGYLASFIENLPLQWPEPFSGFANIRFFNQYQLWLFFLISLPLLIYPNVNVRLRVGIKINAIGWAILLFVSGSRGAIGAVFLILMIVFFVFKRSALLLIKLNLQILGLGFLGSQLLFKVLPLLLQSDITLGWRSVDQMATDAPRLYLWKTALNYMVAHPWLGIGAMHYAYYPNLIALHPHNSLLQWGAEMGVPSLVIIIILVTSALVAWIKQINTLDKNAPYHFAELHLRMALFCSMSTGLIYSMVDGVIVMPVSQILMTTTAGWMFGLYFQSGLHSNSVTAITGTKNLLAFALISIVSITLAYTVVPGLIARLVMLDDAQIPISGARPRFWHQGEINKLSD